MLIKNIQLGQSLVEVVAALGIFLIIVSSGVVIVLGSLSTSRLGEEETQASAMATEGLEAVQSIANANWDDLVVGDHGLLKSGGVWTFSGASDQDASGKFTRVITISGVERDSNGDIVDSGGTVDPDTFLVTSSVAWDFTPARQNQIAYTTILTNWEEGVGIAVSSPTPTSSSTPSPSPSPTTTPTPTPTPTVTPTPTPTPTLTPSPTPTLSSCSSYCASIGYMTGTCRKKISDCTSNVEVYESGGNYWCSTPTVYCCCLAQFTPI